MSSRPHCWLLSLAPLVLRVLPAYLIVTLATAVSAAQCINPPNGLVALYGGNGTMVDPIGGNHGFSGGAVTFSNAVVGQGFVFQDDPSSYLRLPASTSWMPAGNQFSIECWILPDFTVTGDKLDTIFSKRDGCSTLSYHFGVFKGHQGAAKIGLLYFGVGAFGLESTNRIPADGKFHHLAAVCDGSQTVDNVRLYIDGKVVGSGSASISIPNTTSSPVIGQHGGCNYFSSAVMDEISFYNRSLTGAEVQGVYAAGAAGKCAPAVAGVSAPYFNNFETGVESAWSMGTIETSEPERFTQFLGRFGSGGPMLTVTGLTVGVSYTLGFDLYVIDSWDGGSALTGDDFAVWADSASVFRESFSNYNGNPPGGAQSFPRSPDEGRANFGFNASLVDAIYRSIEINFTASNAISVIRFQGANLQAVDDESWGLDNVRVRTTASATTTIITSSSLPSSGSPQSVSLSHFTASSSKPLQPSSATNAANWSLRSAGPNGLLGDADDVAITLGVALPPAFFTGRSFSFTILNNAPLQPGRYRFSSGVGLLDTNGAAVAAYSQDFVLAHPTAGRLEAPGSDSTATASDLGLTETPSGSGFRTSLGIGAFAAAGDVDYWRFDAESGDVVTLRLETQGVGSNPQMQLQNVSGNTLIGASGGADGVVGIERYRFTGPGTYFVRVWSDQRPAPYRLRVDLARGLQLESEPNDSIAQAVSLNFIFNSGLAQARVAGSMLGDDDYFSLLNFSVGNSVSVSARYPDGSTLPPQGLVMTLLAGSAPVFSQSGNTLNFTLSANTNYFLKVSSTNTDLRGQYVLDIVVSDSVPPQITGGTLPSQGGLTGAILNRFTLNFSEDMSASTVTNPALYELRGAGPDGTFNTADDSLYPLLPDPYTTGLSEGYSIVDGPAQPGLLRLRITTALADRIGNGLAAPYELSFTVTNPPGYLMETRGNQTMGTATPFIGVGSGSPSGVLGWAYDIGGPSNPQELITADMNSDGKPDLIVPYRSGSVSVFTNDGSGQMLLMTNFANLSDTPTVAVGRFNNDNLPDIAVSRYGSGAITLLLGIPGGWAVGPTISGVPGPYQLVAADFNNDGYSDLAVPNFGGGNLVVLLANGDGTFKAPVTYAVTGNVYQVVAGKLNNDANVDLVATSTSGQIAVLLGKGDGTFQAPVYYPSGGNTRSVAVGDLSGDSILDVVTYSENAFAVNVLIGNGDGTFKPLVDYVSGVRGAYDLRLGDFNGDGLLDVVVPGNGSESFSVLLNNGGGALGEPSVYPLSAGPIGAAVADFNLDGRLDVMISRYNSSLISLYVGVPSVNPPQDPPGSGIRSAFVRGALASGADSDFYQFSGIAGEQVVLAIETPGAPGSSGLRVDLYRSDSVLIQGFYSNANGWGQSAPITLPTSGNYFVRVTESYAYRGEYRLRLTRASAGIGFETEDNNAISTANYPSFVSANNQLNASVAGYLSYGDAAGDYFDLGLLEPGTSVNLGLLRPSSSGSRGILTVHNSTGLAQASSVSGATNLQFTVPNGGAGNYYARVTADPLPPAQVFGGQPGSALLFNGADQFVKVADSPSLRPVNLTLEAWANFTALDGSRVVVGKGLGSQDNDSYALWYESGQLRGVIGNGPSLGFPWAPELGRWYHLAYVFDDAANTQTLFVDGQQAATGAVNVSISYDAGPLHIGADSAYLTANYFFAGKLDEVRVWSVARAASEIAATRSSRLVGNEAGLAGCWRFDEGAGSTASDATANGNTGTLFGFPVWSPSGVASPAPDPISAQYLLTLQLQKAQPLQLTSISLPGEGSGVSNIWQTFTVGFNTELDPRINLLGRSIFTRGGSHYLMTDAPMKWKDAEAFAISLGGHLAKVSSADLNVYLQRTFSSIASGDLWIGLTDQLNEGTFSWVSGGGPAFTNWRNGQPDNSSGADYAVLGVSDGGWYDDLGGALRRGLVEAPALPDGDGDGFANALDPYPTDKLNAFDLRSSGTDGQFDTADDVVYRLTFSPYSRGTNLSFTVVDGPLQNGSYRFTATTSVRDRFGNGLAANFVRKFFIVPLGGYVLEGRTNNSIAQATAMNGGLANGPMNGTLRETLRVSKGHATHHLVATNLNGDAYLDLIANNFSDDSITIQLGQADGSFLLSTNLPVGNGPVGFSLSDLNKDGKLDLSVNLYNAGRLAIFLGDGTGRFTAFTNYPTLSNPYYQTVTDLNGDGKLDILVANSSSGKVSVFYGLGDGTFQPRVDLTADSGTIDIAVADLVGDGKADDLVVLNRNAQNFMALIANGDGTYKAPVSYAATTTAGALALYDFDADGRPDVVVISGSTLCYFAGNGDGTFAARKTFEVGTSDPYQLALADMDSNGTMDVVIASYTGNAVVTVMNLGKGQFGGGLIFPVSANPIAVALGDFNRDGRIDVATANYNSDDIAILSSLPSQPFSLDATTLLQGGAVRGILVDASDVDYWSFSANANDKMTIAVESADAHYLSRLHYSLIKPDGRAFDDFYPEAYGRGDYSAVLTASGNYTIRVEPYDAYVGEYRLRVTLAPNSYQYETENNNTAATADALSFTFTGGRQTADVFGYFGSGDSADFFRLGNLSGGTEIALKPARPATGTVLAIPAVFNPAGALVASGSPGQTDFTYVIPAGQGGAYSARLTPAFATLPSGATTALWFDGATASVNVGAWSPGNKFAVQAWTMPTGPNPGRRTIAGAMGGCQDWGVVLLDGRPGVSYRPLGGGCSSTITAPGLAEPGKWMHIAGVSDGTNVFLYVNGVLAASAPAAPDWAPYGGGVLIGAEICCGNYYNGLISGVSIWNRPLTSQEVTAFAGTNPTGNEAGLVGYWPLDEGTGLTVKDLGSLHRTGTLVNGVTWAALAAGSRSGAGILAEYRLGISLRDVVPPSITGTTLPAAGSSTNTLIDRFDVSFSEDMAPATVTAAGSYELRNAGPDLVFDTADDSTYTVLNVPAYTTGLVASYLIPDGPLQPGRYRFTARTTLADTSGNALSSSFVQIFTLTTLAGFAQETRSNDTIATAVRLGQPAGGILGPFRPGAGLGVGGNPEYALLQDLNNDSKLDLLVINYGANSNAVYLGNGDGTFVLKTNWQGSGKGGLQPVLADFNGDTFLDLAVGNYGSASVSIYLGNGTGGFNTKTNYDTGVNPVGVVAGDFNKDGRMDLALANYGSSTLSVLLGKGDGTFQPAVTYPVGGRPYQLVAGDFNNDGRLDLVCPNSDTDNLALFIGKADGTFFAPTTIPAGDAPYSARAADLDGDGNLDLVSGSSDGTLYILRGNGNGTFQPPLKLATGLSPQYDIAVGDFDKNGRLDIAVTGYNQDRVAILLQSSTMVFEPSQSFPVGNSPIGVAVGDINGDGRPDLVIASYTDSQLTFLLGRETESLPPDGPTQVIATARGLLFNNSDQDFWSFPAKAGDSVQVALENVGDPGATGRCIDLYAPNGSVLENWCTDYYGRGGFSRSLPNSGIYYLRVRNNYNSIVEYRLRVSVVSAPVQVDSEYNSAYQSAQGLVWSAAAGQRSATVFGALHRDDPAGDFYKLGNLAAGVLIQLTANDPPHSTLTHQWALFKGGALVTNSAPAATSFAYSVPVGAADDYAVRVQAVAGTDGLMATYLLTLQLFDGEGPQVVSTSLPAPGTTTFDLLDRFSVSFSEDLNPEVTRLARRPSLYGGHAYLRTSVASSWRVAAAEAKAMGGNLVTINDASENQWLLDQFGGGLWIGLTDEAQEGAFAWQDGAPLSYVNWNPGEPNNSGQEDYAVLMNGGQWNDESLAASHFGIIEFSGVDSDGDGMPDTADAYPSDPLNVFDLRAAGADDLFDTPDDVIYQLQASDYASGTSMSFFVLNGPLQEGRVRFRVTPSIRDVFGNLAASTYDQIFRLGGVTPFQTETQSDDLPATAVALALQEGPANFSTAAGRGKLSSNADLDYWSLNAKAGDLLTLSVDIPGNPGASRLRYQVLNPDGSVAFNQVSDYYGPGYWGPIPLAATGTYRLLVSAYDGYLGEYRFRVSLASPPLLVEVEPNETITTATPLAFQQDANARFASVLGTQGLIVDLDYFDLGILTNGSSVFLNVRLPQSSSFVPVVALYNAGGQYQEEVQGGRSGDGIAEVRILTTGKYFALVRGGAGSPSTLNAQYQLDVQVVPTGTVSFPNLQVTGTTFPGGAPLSGQDISFGFTVANVGQLATPVGSWVDRAVLSQNSVLGDADDIPLGFFNHLGALNAAQGYAVNGSATLPEGVSGDFYLIAQTDAGNVVNEFIFETDNVTVSAGTFHVTRAPYPDLKVEDLQWSGPTGKGDYTLRWRTANRGDGSAKKGFRDRLIVRNLNTGQVLATSDIPVSPGFAAGALLQRETVVTTTNAGTYLVQVATDALDEVFEFDATSHSSAENNTATTQFIIAQYFDIAVVALPAEGGSVTGGGSFVSGNPATVTAKPNTNDRPYFFVNWTEAGVFQSAATDYTFSVSRPRSLVANFSLPAYSVLASNNPVVAGSVDGQGTYFHGATAVLTANPNPGYRFINWTEQGQVVGLFLKLTNSVTTNHFIVANYAEANPKHVVTTATSPENLATVSGSGTFSNGQSTTVAAPSLITNSPTLFSFREFRLNGAPNGLSPSFSKTFSTLDPSNIQYVAYYDSNSLLPVVVKAVGGFTNIAVGGFSTVTNPVPATTQYFITLQFDRSMNPGVTPLVLITNAGASVQPVVTGAGYWLATIASNDTYRTPPITFSNGMDGLAIVKVSKATDVGALKMDPADVMAMRIDVTPPAQPQITLVSSNSSSATFSWDAYSPPADLGSFRVYRSLAPFTSLAGLPPLTTLGKNARSFFFGGLALDTPYYVAIVAVDDAGNAPLSTTSTLLTLPRSIPPPVALTVTASDLTTASLSWPGYSTASLLGFDGFKVFYQTSPFSSVQGLTAKQSLAAGERNLNVPGLDRHLTYYFAVVGFNSAGGLNVSVTSQKWSDPFAGKITSSLTLGSAQASVIDILQPMLVTSNSTLTIRAGTTVRFAPGAGIVVDQGTVIANGAALDPIILTSSNDAPGFEANPGDWSGIVLGTGSGNSTLRHMFIRYGAGLTLSNSSPTVEAVTATRNTPAGLRLLGNASLTTTAALIAFNDIGLQNLSSGSLSVTQSVVKNNGTNALAGAGSLIVATENWWGTPVAADIAATLRGSVDRNAFLLGEPLLTPAIGLLNNVTQVGSRDISIRLACRTADAMRVSENSAFLAVFYQAFSSPVPFQLSEGGGAKTIYAQFRSVTGQTSAPVALNLTYITAGPTLATVSLTEGQNVTRPLTITASASAPLGMSGIDLLVDDELVTTQAGGSFSYRYDVRTQSSGVHRVKVAARDTSGNLATRELNITLNLAPPPAPVITTPAVDLNGNDRSITVKGTAEPLIPIRLIVNSTPAVTGAADANGNWSFDNVPLVEGNNAFVASAFDALGSAASEVRNVVSDTGPPTAPILDTLYYNLIEGLSLTWVFAPTGERPTFFRVYWHSNSFTTTGQAGQHSSFQTAMTFRPSGLQPGKYFFAVAGYDAAGNESALSNVMPFLYDPIPPSFIVSFDKVAPVGVGPLKITIVASEPLVSPPTLTLLPYNSTPVSLTVSNAALNTFEAVLNVTPAFPSGALGMIITGRDLSGNTFNGPPSGQPMQIDVQAPSGRVVTVPPGPVQTTNSPVVTVSLTLSEPAKPGTTPTMNFAPPVGPLTPVVLAGSGSNWVGTFTATPSMGSGFGNFTLTARDALDNLGQVISSGQSLELYNTPLPKPPGQPVNFQVASLSEGRVRLSWNSVSNAELYRLYSQPGTNILLVPTTLVADNILSNSWVDLPPADGYFLYVVSAVRRGAEGTNSITRAVLSDRTPPSAPIQVAVQLLSSGVQVAWKPGTGEAPYSYKVYRNGQLIRNLGGAEPNAVNDSPPRGVMSYTVAAVDNLGNEALSAPAVIELFVGAVQNFTAMIRAGQAPVLSWNSSDNTAVGYNVYRNGVKQNGAPVTALQFTDSLGIPSGSRVQYVVRSVNSTNAESAPRTVDVNDVTLDLFQNLANTAEQPLVTDYFDNLFVVASNRTTSAPLPAGVVQVRRSIIGLPSITRSNSVHTVVPQADVLESSVILPASSVTDPQTFLVRLYQEVDAGGSTAIYENSFGGGTVVRPQSRITLSATQPPLAGGLSTLSVIVFNPGFADIDLLVNRNNGVDPGDLNVSVRNPLGAEVTHLVYKGTPPGASFTADGRGYLRIPAGGSRNIIVDGILVPEALSTNTATFVATCDKIYYHLARPEEDVSGPISGSMVSDLSVTPYYGIAKTDRLLYADDRPILISGQAIDRLSGNPKPNALLRIGFAISGAKFWQNVTSDISGGFTYLYSPPQGMSGTLHIWAAHPDVVDTLNQVEVKLYRCYLSPANVDIRMSKNGTQRFFLTLINTGDELLTGFSLTAQTFAFDGPGKTLTTKIKARSLMETNFILQPRSTEKINFELEAELDAPDLAGIDFSLRSSEGASAKFHANLTLLEADPLLVVIEPSVGYVEASVNRGELRSKSITILNRGLRPLEGVAMQMPTNVAWMSVNLPADARGVISLPDLPIGSSNSFTIVFAPPASTALDSFQDKLIIRGTNSPAVFEVGLYALVTSEAKGSVKFYVDDILVEAVPNATVRIRNTLLGQDFTVKTDANGFVTVNDLQEGPWAWQVTASGHSAQVGVIDVIPDQTVLVETRLSRALVTVNFSVVPVPYTDRYEIVIEQTFETHVPAPVLVLTPPHMDFKNVGYGYEVTYIVTAKNYGLIQLTDVTIRGMSDGHGGVLSPLISYIPILRAQESVEIPMRFTFLAPTAKSGSGSGGKVARNYTDRRKNLTRDIDADGNITGGVQFPPSFGDNATPAQGFADCATGGLGGLADFFGGLMAIANGCATCADLRTALQVAATVAVTYALLCSPTFSPFPVSPLPCPSGNWVVSFFINLASCICQALGCFGSGGNGGGNSNGGSGNNSPQGFAQFSPSGPGCFVKGTLVHMFDGSTKTIEDVKPGDHVKTGISAQEFALVREVQSRQIPDLLVLDCGQRSLETSPEHQLWVDGKGWTTASHLKAGDWLSDLDGKRVRIADIRSLHRETTVYTFVNSGDHTFYANGILVHDSCGTPAILSPYARPLLPTMPSEGTRTKEVVR
ncbi:MAG: VCBS repeat-containing protein [Verrucomicrobia bacterium]|nr:VCBS repeat-containing protein [Verrucomicrobiota bacterium]